MRQGQAPLSGFHTVPTVEGDREARSRSGTSTRADARSLRPDELAESVLAKQVQRATARAGLLICGRVVLLRDRDDVKSEAARQDDRQLDKLRESRQQRRRDEDVGASSSTWQR